MKIRTIFDKSSVNRDLQTGWGVSFLIDGHTLLDTGEKGEWLLHNMKSMDIDPAGIDNVILSHDHWDHTGGLWKLIEERPGLSVYACRGFSDTFKKKINSLDANFIEVEKMIKITDNIYSSGEIEGIYKGYSIYEQAVAVRTQQGISIITGCAHPGITVIISKIKELFPDEELSLVAGGFHLMDSKDNNIKNIVHEFRESGVKRAGPTHCSGDKAQEMFEEEYKEDFVHIVTGEDFEV